MPGVRVVTDSACDLTGELAAAGNIIVVPLTIRFGDEELARPAGPHARRVLASLQGSRPPSPRPPHPRPAPSTRPSRRRPTTGADGVLCLTISSGVSPPTSRPWPAPKPPTAGTRPGRRHPILTMGQGLLAWPPPRRQRRCRTSTTWPTHVDDLIGRTRVFGVLGTLDHLQRGGRIGGAAALVGSLLSIKPVIQVQDGVVEQESKQRTRARVARVPGGQVQGRRPLRTHRRVQRRRRRHRRVVSDRWPAWRPTHELVVVDLGPVVGTHAGPGTIGICYQLCQTPETGPGWATWPAWAPQPRLLRTWGPPTPRRPSNLLADDRVPLGPAATGQPPSTGIGAELDGGAGDGRRPGITGPAAAMTAEWPKKAATPSTWSSTPFTTKPSDPSSWPPEWSCSACWSPCSPWSSWSCCSVGLLRLLDVYAFSGRVWISYAVLGCLFTLAGLVRLVATHRPG